MLDGDYVPAIDSGPPPLGGGTDIDAVVQAIKAAANPPTPRSVSTILRIVNEQLEVRPRSAAFLWFLAASVTLMGIAFIAFPGDTYMTPEVGIPMLLAAYGFILYQVRENRELITKNREEAGQICEAAIQELISISDQEITHKNLHKDRVAIAKRLLKRGGEPYRAALIQILDQAQPDQPFPVPSNL